MVVGSDTASFMVSVEVTLYLYILDTEAIGMEVEAAAHVALVPSRGQRGEAVSVLR